MNDNNIILLLYLFYSYYYGNALAMPMHIFNK